jgi:hypothetical protein
MIKNKFTLTGLKDSDQVFGPVQASVPLLQSTGLRIQPGQHVCYESDAVLAVRQRLQAAYQRNSLDVHGL